MRRSFRGAATRFFARCDQFEPDQFLHLTLPPLIHAKHSHAALQPGAGIQTLGQSSGCRVATSQRHHGGRGGQGHGTRWEPYTLKLNPATLHRAPNPQSQTPNSIPGPQEKGEGDSQGQSERDPHGHGERKGQGEGVLADADAREHLVLEKPRWEGSLWLQEPITRRVSRPVLHPQ